MSGFILFVVFVALILIGGYLKAKKEDNATPLFPAEEPTYKTGRNPALDELKLRPQSAITAGLIAAVPGLAVELYGEATKQANALGISDPDFIDCIFDLELVAVFEKTMIFTGDKNLASLFIDAMIFEATGKNPSVPSAADMMACLTHQHRGLAKYALSKKYYSVPDPGAWLFGAEYVRAKGNALNPAYVAAAGKSVLYIRRTGAWAAEKALTGKSPTQEETDALTSVVSKKRR